VTTASSATDRVLLDSQTMLFPRATPQAIRAALELLQQNPALARDLGARAQSLYKESFQPAVIVTRIRNVASHPVESALLKREPVLNRQ
jgi:hypothetical protein